MRRPFDLKWDTITTDEVKELECERTKEKEKELSFGATY